MNGKPALILAIGSVARTEAGAFDLDQVESDRQQEHGSRNDDPAPTPLPATAELP